MSRVQDFPGTSKGLRLITVLLLLSLSIKIYFFCSVRSVLRFWGDYVIRNRVVLYEAHVNQTGLTFFWMPRYNNNVLTTPKYLTVSLPLDNPGYLWPIRLQHHCQPFVQNQWRTQIQPIQWSPPPNQKKLFQRPNQLSKTASSSPLRLKQHSERIPRVDLLKRCNKRLRDKRETKVDQPSCLLCWFCRLTRRTTHHVHFEKRQLIHFICCSVFGGEEGGEILMTRANPKKSLGLPTIPKKNPCTKN